MTTRAADDHAAIRARMAELRRPPVVPGSEPTMFTICTMCRWSSHCWAVRRCTPDGVVSFRPDNCVQSGGCCDPHRCTAIGYCDPFQPF